LVIQTFGSGQHHAGAPGQQRLSSRTVRHRLQSVSFFGRQY
jgi:hypothetical protein